jgi:hypothetical protein
MDPPVDTAYAAVGNLWRENPHAVEWALAELIADDLHTTRITGSLAADAYYRLSGRAGPVLASLEKSIDQARRYYVLAAIHAPLSPLEAEIVFGYACQYVQLLQALERDRSEWGQAISPPWALQAEAALLHAYRTLDEHRRLLLKPAILAALPDNGVGRLAWIDEH